MCTSGHPHPWWRHKMETFSALLALCARNSPVPGEIPAQRPVKRGFDVFFDLRLYKPLSKQWRGWLFETLSGSLWRHCNALVPHICVSESGFDNGLSHWGRDKIDAIWQMTFSNAFSWLKMNDFLLEFHWSLFLRFESTIFHHWYR